MATVTKLVFNRNLLDLDRVSKNRYNIPVCPILHDEILEGSTVYRMGCCNKIFSEGVIDWLKKSNRCPTCSKIINVNSVLTLKDYFILQINKPMSKLFFLSVFSGIFQGIITRNIFVEDIDAIEDVVTTLILLLGIVSLSPDYIKIVELWGLVSCYKASFYLAALL